MPPDGQSVPAAGGAHRSGAHCANLHSIPSPHHAAPRATRRPRAASAVPSHPQPNPYAQYSTQQKINALVRGISGHQRWNEALARARDADTMLDLLQQASDRIGLDLTRQQLATTAPIRDWIWFKRNSPLLTIGRQDAGPYKDSERR